MQGEDVWFSRLLVVTAINYLFMVCFVVIEYTNT